MSDLESKAKIICLCGSTKFKDIYEDVEKELALQGYLVISTSCFGHQDSDKRIWERKEMLDEIHKQKILLSDEIFVINAFGYIGESTKNEIEFAKQHGKQICYLSTSSISTNYDYCPKCYRRLKKEVDAP